MARKLWKMRGGLATIAARWDYWLLFVVLPFAAAAPQALRRR